MLRVGFAITCVNVDCAPLEAIDVNVVVNNRGVDVVLWPWLFVVTTTCVLDDNVVLLRGRLYLWNKD